jgi:hypothetical protein
MATVITRFLRKFVAPALPNSPINYVRTDEDQFRNILRLYFNQISRDINLLASNIGGAYLQFPNGAFHQDGYTTLTTTIPNGVSTSDIVVFVFVSVAFDFFIYA